MRTAAGVHAGLDVPARLFLALAGLAAAYLIAAPVTMLVVAALRGPADYLPFEPAARWTLAHFASIYADPVLYRQILPDTLGFVGGAVVLGYALAFALAWLVERTDLPAPDLWFALVVFPFLLPSVVLAIGWIFLAGPNAGWLNLGLRAAFGLQGEGPVNIFSMSGLIVCQALASVPFVFLLLGAVLRSMNPALEEASGTSGASPRTTFLRVTLPVLLPGLLAPAILSTLITLEQMEMPLIIGLPARVNVFSYRIWYELNPSSGLPSYGAAAAVALPFLLLGIALLFVYNHLIRRADRFVTVTGKAYRRRRFALGRWKLLALLFVATYVAVAGLLPTLVLLWTSLYGYAVPSAEVLGQASLEAYAKLFADRIFWLAARNTLLVAVLSALITVVLGGLLAWIIVRTRLPGRRLLDFLSFLSIGIPSVIAGLAVMILYLSVPIGVYGTVWILVIAYSYRLAVTTRMSRAGLMQIQRELEEASATSGARWFATQWRIVVPLLMPTLVSAFVLLFITGVREFTMGLVLNSEQNVVLSVLLWRLFEAGEAAPSAALATLIVALVLPIVFLARRLATPRATAQA